MAIALETLAALRAQFPDWTSDQGACKRCLAGTDNLFGNASVGQESKHTSGGNGRRLSGINLTRRNLEGKGAEE